MEHFEYNLLKLPAIMVLLTSIASTSGSGSQFGTMFKISTFGESHGSGVGVIVDGCPPRIPLLAEDIQVMCECWNRLQ